MEFFGRRDQEDPARIEREHQIISLIQGLPLEMRMDLRVAVSRRPLVPGRLPVQVLNPERLAANNLPREFSRLTKEGMQEFTASYHRSVCYQMVVLVALALGVHFWTRSAETENIRMASLTFLFGMSASACIRLSYVSKQLEALGTLMPEPVLPALSSHASVSPGT